MQSVMVSLPMHSVFNCERAVNRGEIVKLFCRLIGIILLGTIVAGIEFYLISPSKAPSAVLGISAQDN
jgi:hypothetical protein